MEPVSTLIAITSLAAAAATARPRWEPPRIKSKDEPNVVVVTPRAAPTDVLITPAPATKSALLIGSPQNSNALGSPQFLSIKDKLLNELKTYEPGNLTSNSDIVSDIEDIRTASAFLKMLPAGIALPTLMRTDDGQIGMYWDNDDVYIDINIDPAQTISMFMRVRSAGTETFIDGIPISDTGADWAFEHLGVLTMPRVAA